MATNKQHAIGGVLDQLPEVGLWACRRQCCQPTWGDSPSLLEAESNLLEAGVIGYGSFYAFAFALPMRLHYINKSNQYWSSYVAPFMQLHSRYQCVTNALPMHSFSHQFRERFKRTRIGNASLLHVGNDVMYAYTHTLSSFCVLTVVISVKKCIILQLHKD